MLQQGPRLSNLNRVAINSPHSRDRSCHAKSGPGENTGPGVQLWQPKVDRPRAKARGRAKARARFRARATARAQTIPIRLPLQALV